ncbi:MAG: hypothetical protein Q8L20_13090 [Gammaproteobacteria bacterium]|nr:hypothetical protein [Gammaproteobacteria bacterium]
MASGIGRTRLALLQSYGDIAFALLLHITPGRRIPGRPQVFVRNTLAGNPKMRATNKTMDSPFYYSLLCVEGFSWAAMMAAADCVVKDQTNCE